MAYPPYVREKARKLRVENKLSVVEIADRLALPKTTIWYWVRDIPLARPRATTGQRKGNLAMRERYRRLREEAYAQGKREFTQLASDPTFRDFVCMYIGEGYKRSRNYVSLGNSDPRVVRLAARWIGALAMNPVRYWLQYHADQDLEQLQLFWGGELAVPPSEIRFQRKSNSGALTGRIWRSEHGVLTVRVGDTLLRARLQGWMDSLQDEWLDSLPPGRSAAW
jgi:transposase-like protein